MSPAVHKVESSEVLTLLCHSEEEDPDDYPFPLTLRAPKKPIGPNSPVEGLVNGNGSA